jgi:hypothetical protein
MPGMKIDILGVKELQAKLNKLPIEAADEAVDKVMDYMVNVLKTDQPTPKHVSRADAYPKIFATSPVTGTKIPGFKSWKQFKYVMWLWNTGQTPYSRTQEISRGWHKVKTGITGHIVNYTKGVAYVVGDKSQANLNRMVGWKTVGQQIEDRLVKINQIIDAAAKKAIRKLGLG